jgi:broad specificity phosphatase PhoE
MTRGYDTQPTKRTGPERTGLPASRHDEQVDVLVVGLLALGCLALVVAGGLDARRMLRARREPAPAPSAPTGPRRVVIVRHGETAWSRTGRHTGCTDVPLTDAGRAEASALAPALAGWTFDAVLVSPLERARDTLALLGRPEPPTVLEDLREWDYGDDEGRTTVEIRAERPGWDIWDAGPAGGETVDDLVARTARVLRRAAEVDGDVLVVAHGHVLRVLAARWLGLDPRAGRLLALDPASMSVLDHEREQRVLRSWNVRAPSAPGDAGR